MEDIGASVMGHIERADVAGGSTEDVQSGVSGPSGQNKVPQVATFALGEGLLFCRAFGWVQPDMRGQQLKEEVFSTFREQGWILDRELPKPEGIVGSPFLDAYFEPKQADHLHPKANQDNSQGLIEEAEMWMEHHS